VTRIQRLAPYLRVRAASLPEGDPERTRIRELLGDPTWPPTRHWSEGLWVLAAIAIVLAMGLGAARVVVTRL